MADAQYGEGRQFNLHSAGTDLVEGSALAVKSSTGAIAVDGKTVGSVNALYVAISDGSGNQITSFAGTQYAADAAIGYASTGTVALGVAKAAAPTDMTADGDAVALWALRNGSQVVNIASGGTLWTNMGQTAATGQFARVTDGTTTAGVIVSTTALKTDLSSVAGTATVTGNIAGVQAIAGPTAADAALTAYPQTIGARASTATPTAMSADGDVVNLWASLNGALNVVLRDTGNDAISVSTAMADAESNTINRLEVENYGMAFNGTTWDRVRNINAYKTAAAAPDVGIPAVGLVDRRFTSVSLATAANSVQAWDPTGAAVAVVFVGTSTTGTYTFEVSGDGTNWISADCWDIATETDVSGTSLTPTANKIYRIKAAGYRSIRARTVTTLGSTVALTASLTSWQVTQTPQGNVPHDSVDAGSPLKIGGYANDSAPTAVAAADRTNAWYTTRGALNVRLVSTNGTPYTMNDAGDAVANPTNTAYSTVFGEVFNGTTWDRMRSGGVTGMQGIAGATAADAAIAAYPVTVGGRASAATPTAMSADGDAVNAWFTTHGALNTRLVDASGNALSVGGGTQYAGDAAATSTPTGTISMGLANTSAPTDVSAANDAVALWASPKGALNVIIRDVSGSAIPSDGNGLVIQSATTVDNAITGNPVYIGGRASTATPTAVSADGDAASAWLSRNGALNVIIRDTSGAAVSTGTQYTENDALTANAGVGTLVIGRRDDALSTLTPVEGDAIGLRVGDKGALWVQIADGSGNQITSFGGGTQYVGDAAATSTPTGTMHMGLASATAPTAVSATNDAVAAWFLLNGIQNVRMVDSSGNALSVGGGTQYTEDAAITANAGIGNLMIARRDDSLSTLTPVENDAVGLRVSAEGALWVKLYAAEVSGSTVADAALSANPLTVGARASTATPTAMSADGDAVNLWASRNGALNVTLRDTSGNAVATGTQYTGDSAATATPVGTMQMGLGKATVPTAASADNDAVAAWFLLNGIQNVRLVDSAGTALSVGGGTQYTEDAAITANAGIGNLMVGRRDDALSTLTPVEGDAVGLRVGDKGALWVQISDGAGSQITSFGGGTQYASDTAIGVTPTGTLSIGRASYATPTQMTADGDAVALWASREGALNVILRDDGGDAIYVGTSTGDSHASALNRLLTASYGYVWNGSGWDMIRSGGVIGAQSVAGATAADAAIAAHPVTMGGRASAATPTAMSADGDVVNAWFTTRGALNTRLVDANGDPLSVGGGTQHAADTAIGVTPTGTLAIARGSTATPTAMTADGDAVGLWATLNGSLNVVIRDTSGAAVSTGTQYTEDAALTANAGVGTLVVARRDDALATLTPVENDAVGLRVGDKGALWVQIADGSGNQITSFGGGTQHAADTAIGVTPTGTLAIARASSATPTAMTADGDAVGVWATRAGAMVMGFSQVSAGADGLGTNQGFFNAPSGTDTSALTVIPMLFNGSTMDRQRSGGVTGMQGIAGATAADAAIAANPVTVGARASTAVPTAMSADGDVVNVWANRSGAPVVTQAPHVGLNSDPWNLQSKTAQYTSAQTSTVLVAGGASEKLVVTKLQIQSGGTTAGTCIVYFGTGAYSRGTNRAIFDGEFAPSATLKPGVVDSGPWISGTNGDDILVTTTNAQTVTITVWYYIVT